MFAHLRPPLNLTANTLDAASHTRWRAREIKSGEIHNNNIPRYAILSHTWGTDSEEVTFKDLMEGTGKDKAVYKKIVVESELLVMAYNTSGWTTVVLIGRAALSSVRPLIRCFAGVKMRINATFI